ncbi:hypothetical protein [Roseiconus lacunae]|uniref:Uncharacterized protein n=1 Tax=Roseiconus lacunae TaxID=2605694 RepID=A0ABT7PGC5_9BACT|nr:hypothetical protein [Roseiconus lacunae]MDM4015428.1 hypothetical protein [Roseiconus lacunae]
MWPTPLGEHRRPLRHKRSDDVRSFHGLNGDGGYLNSPFGGYRYGAMAPSWISTNHGVIVSVVCLDDRNAATVQRSERP